jgi:hypothetical protein
MKYIKYHSFWVWLNAWIFLVDELCVICTGPYVWNPMLGFKFLAFIAKKEINERIKERKLR